MSQPKADVIPILNPVYAKRLAHRNRSSHKSIWDLLDQVHDPELPGLTIWDLGILQDVYQDNETWIVAVTPTYSGCPAVDAINQDIISVMQQAGYQKVQTKLVLSPAWETDMISPAGRAHLKSIHIAPPDVNDQVSCPQCDSQQTKLISQFGSTGCKALYQCSQCLETFDYFKHL